MTQDTNRTLLIGAGPMAVAYAKALSAMEHPFDVAGRGQSSAERFHAAIGVMPWTGTLHEQIEKLSYVPDTAIVAVSVADLPEVTNQLLDYGVKRILIEKPGAPTPETMLRLAQNDSKQAARVAYNRRFLPSVRAARRIIVDDGGVQSFHFEFTEIPERVLMKWHPAQVLDHWTLANSSHVLDMAFDLAGASEDLSDVRIAGAVAAGHLDWHSPGSRFAGCGIVRRDITFSYNADWMSGGGWAVEICTPRRRLRMRPLETLTQQLTGGFTVEPVPFEPDPHGLKPGLKGMLENFFYCEGAALPTAAQQAQRLALYDRVVRNPGGA